MVAINLFGHPIIVQSKKRAAGETPGSSSEDDGGKVSTINKLGTSADFAGEDSSSEWDKLEELKVTWMGLISAIREMQLPAGPAYPNGRTNE